jgi:hypothetical protein
MGYGVCFSSTKKTAFLKLNNHGAVDFRNCCMKRVIWNDYQSITYCRVQHLMYRGPRLNFSVPLECENSGLHQIYPEKKNVIQLSPAFMRE